MNYCEKCKLAFEWDICPHCHSSKLRAPQSGDFCFLDERDVIFARMLLDMLRDNGIECFHQPVMGAALAMRTAPGNERYRLYVPYEKLPEARELMEAYFNRS